MNIERFILGFQRNFSAPFVDGVSAELKRDGKVLRIIIGRRDVDFDICTGEVIGAGTSLCEQREATHE